MQFPHRYKKKEDIEVAAFLAATIAWGRRDMIIRNCDRMFTLMQNRPHDFIMSGDFSGLGTKCVHRTFSETDLKYYCRGLKACYTTYGSLESLFAGAGNVWAGMTVFRQTIAKANKGLYSRHIADADSSSACKRLNLSLRWLVRREGPVDLGIWKSIPPASLFIPLDIHVGRIARQLGLLDPARKSNDKKAVLALTDKLREFCPEDPVKYDFAMFGMGVAGEEF
ncbi:MAG: TIGR02757 family protein [Treponema sp.]|nr:TIGR02757 family protein [Treponema sp.]